MQKQDRLYMTKKTFKTLVNVAPHLATEWHPSNNGELSPKTIGVSSSKKIWWKCPKGSDHEWQSTLASRYYQGLGCPFCSNRKVSSTNSLSSLFPTISDEWHPSKNGDILPELVVAGSHKKVWWKCRNGVDHEWQATVKDRTQKKSGCPHCDGRTVSVTNSLISLFPKIAAEWHPAKNGNTLPKHVPAGSKKKVWWKCKIDPIHEWEAEVSGRTGKRKHGCPYCAGWSGQQAKTYDILTNGFADIAKQWHPTKNGTLTPDAFRGGSSKKIWWLCSKGPDHEWKARIADRIIKKSGCPCCDGRKVSITNSLESLFPEITGEWHPTKNGAIKPVQFTSGSHKKVWWKCAKGPDHEWQATIHARTGRGDGYSFCDGKKVSVTNSLLTLFPHIAAEWHPVRNGRLTPEQVTSGTPKSAWWKCTINPDHEWKAKILNRTINKSGCPGCADPGFDQTKPAILYYIRIKTENRPLYKIDITNRTVNERFPLYADQITVVAIWEYPFGIEAMARETEILRTFKNQLYEGPSVIGTSNAEIFEFDVLDLDK